MSEYLKPTPEHLNLALVDQSLQSVQDNWSEINELLAKHKIGAKNPPFNSEVRQRMMIGYEYLDKLILQDVEPCVDSSLHHMLALNTIVLYGNDHRLRMENAQALKETSAHFYDQVEYVSDWYKRHKKRGDDFRKITAEVYIAILGQPQLFKSDGNHRTGALIASWVNMQGNYPPFVLSSENALAYFAPSIEIKHLTHKSEWRKGRHRLPKYRKSFLEFWENHTDSKYSVK